MRGSYRKTTTFCLTRRRFACPEAPVGNTYVSLSVPVDPEFVFASWSRALCANRRRLCRVCAPWVPSAVVVDSQIDSQKLNLSSIEVLGERERACVRCNGC